MLTPAQLSQFRQQGFLKGSKVLSDEQVDVLREEMQRVIDNRGKEGPPARALPQPGQA